MYLKNTEYKNRFFKLGESSCAYCGKILNDDPPNSSKVCVDHIVPKCKNGGCDPSNLTFSCFRCNQKKGGRSVEEFKNKTKRRIIYIESELAYHKKIAEKLDGVR